MKIHSWFILLTGFILLSSCSKEEETFTYNQADFYGIWELSDVSSENFDYCKNNPPKLIISKEEIEMLMFDLSSGCNSENSSSSDYSFDGSSFNIYSFSSNGNFTVTAKDLNKFSWERNLDNTTQSFTYIRNN